MGPPSVVGHPASSDALPDFTGYWRLLRTEGFDEFCRELGFPWVVRKAALRFMGGGSSVDVIAQSGTARDTTLTITSLNPKGSWMRTYDTARDVVQQNAEGTRCKTTAWWEGRVFHSKMEPPPGASFGTIESLRYLHRDFQVVKTVVKLPKGTEAVMYWYFDRMVVLEQHLAKHGGLRWQITLDQQRVERATVRDNAYLRDVLLDWQRWRSPADDFVPMMSPAYNSRSSRLRLRAASVSSSPRGTMSKSPSDAELSTSNLPAGIEVRSETTTARSIAKSDSRSRLGASELGAVDAKSMGRSDSRSRLAGLEAGGPASSSGAEAGGQAGANHTAAAPTSAAAGAAPPPVVATAAAAAGHAPQWEAHATSSPRLMRDISLAPDRTQHMLQAVLPTEPRLPHTQLSDITFQTFAAPVPLETIPSGAATRGSGSVALEPSVGPFHVRVPSSDSLATGRAARHHVKSFSADSGHGLSPSDGRSSPAPWSGRSTPTHRQLAVASGAEHLLSFKLHDYLDGRSISSVVPLSTPNDTSEPQLLGMSPEQAEETAGRLRELEGDMLLRRQDSRHGFACCGLVISRQSNSLPEHLRVWEMTLE